MKDTEVKRLVYQDSEAFKEGVKVGKKEMIEKAVEWVKENFECYVGADVSPYYIYVDEFVEDFRKAITEEE